jgi:phage tail-like protein
MTCAPTAATFRLLDDIVGWDQREATNLTGFDKETGVRLAKSDTDPDGPTRTELLPWFPDPRLAPGCQPCAWYLIAGRRLLRRDTCDGGWLPALRCDPQLLRAPTAVGARGHRLVVVDSGRVYVWRNVGDHLVGVIDLDGAHLAAPGSGDQVLVTRTRDTRLWRFGSDGRLRDVLDTGVLGEIIGLRTGPGRAVWLLTDDGDKLRIYGGLPIDASDEFDVDELVAALPPSGLVAAGDDGFCLRENGPDGTVTTCYTWLGTPRPEPAPAGGQYYREGEFVTDVIDSGISRCRWHRVRVTADVPEGTAVTVAVVVSEDNVFADSDWQTAPPGVTDFLIDQPPGRFLTARVRLSGDTATTPVLHRIRLDFPRTTSADLLPAAFRQDPAADDFTERFLSLFDATLDEVDQVIERYPALLDPAGVPDRALPWLAGLLGLTFESGWDAATRRQLLAEAPELYRRRGTRWAVKRAVEIVFGVVPVLDELACERRWAHVRAAAGPAGAAGLGCVRLFGRSASRFRVGGSPLGAAPLRAFGDPDTDPLTEHAHRFRVLLPAGQVDEDALRRVVTRQAPAHTMASVRTGGAGFVVGTRSAVGVDTAFVPLPAPVVGGIRLNHDGVLRPGPRGARHGVSVGVVSAVGIHTQIS